MKKDQPEYIIEQNGKYRLAYHSQTLQALEGKKFKDTDLIKKTNPKQQNL